MLRLGTPLLSSALQPNNAFVKSALELVKLHYAHRNAIEDKDLKVAAKIEDAFIEELYEFRPLFSIAESVKVGRPYSQKIYGAMRYFGLGDDPLARQLESILGRAQRKKGSKIAVFRGLSSSPSAGGAVGADEQLDARRETIIEERPEERPLPPEHVYSALGGANGGKPRRGLYPDQHRGHWVLQDEELIIKREDRAVDPW